MTTTPTTVLPIEVSAHAILRYLERATVEGPGLIQEARDLIKRSVPVSARPGVCRTELEDVCLRWIITGKNGVQRISRLEDLKSMSWHPIRATQSNYNEHLEVPDAAVIDVLRHGGADELIESVTALLTECCPKQLILDRCMVTIPGLKDWRICVAKHVDRLTVTTLLSPSEMPATNLRKGRGRGAVDNTKLPGAGSSGKSFYGKRNARRRKSSEAGKQREEGKKQEREN